MFYDKFNQLCKERGISCNKAAKEIGLSNATVTKWKKTSAIPKGETLNRVATYFGVSTDYLLEKETVKTPTDAGECDILDEVDMAFYGDYQQLDEDQKETVRDMVRLMRDRQAKKHKTQE